MLGRKEGAPMSTAKESLPMRLRVHARSISLPTVQSESKDVLDQQELLLSNHGRRLSPQVAHRSREV
jgi:hypothetical protein